MAGGSGERFWPLSSAERPKQLLKLTNPDRTMLEEAIQRLVPVVDAGQVYISTGKAILGAIERAGLVQPDRILAEPEKKNTLGALVWVAACLEAKGLGEATVAIVTADHVIGDAAAFQLTVEHALSLAETTDGLVTIGIRPDRPETGFGYIEASTDVRSLGGRDYYRAASFREKPDFETAQQFVQAGNYYWNSGMFFWKLSAFRRELRHAAPQDAEILDEIVRALRDGQDAAAVESFSKLRPISIDYALMERAADVFVAPSDFPWDDVGAWDAIERTFRQDADGNVLVGESLVLGSTGSIVLNDCPDRPVAVYGARDLVVVSSAQGVLVVPKEHAQKVREIVSELKKRADQK
jgi:mannose-1-phosphate guanylyltransferase